MDKQPTIFLDRLLVLIQIAFIPIYFIIYTVLWYNDIIQNLSLFFTKSYKIWFITINFSWIPISSEVLWVWVAFGIPIFFSIPWVAFSILRATKIASTYTLMGRALGRIRLDQKVFYGINGTFTLLFFILPLFSPALTVVGIILLVRMLFHKVKLGKIWFWLVPAILLSLFPLILSIAFFFEYRAFTTIVLTFWETWIDDLFGICLCLSIAIAFGNFLLFFQEGAYQYGNIHKINQTSIFVIKIITLTLMLVIYYLRNNLLLINVMSLLALGFGIAVLILRRIKKVESKNSSSVGFVMVPIFSLISFLSTYYMNNLRFLVIILTGIIFIALFLISYKASEDESLFANGEPSSTKQLDSESTLSEDEPDVKANKNSKNKVGKARNVKKDQKSDKI